MSIQHHPQSELLLTYAAGTLDEAASVLVATHLALCPHCRAEVGQLDAVGGVLLDALPATAMSMDALARITARLNTTDSIAFSPPSNGVSQDRESIIPQPLRSYLGADRTDRLPWRNLMGMKYINIKTQGPGRARLLHIPAGYRIVHHGHTGNEFTQVLTGGYSDEAGSYFRGDMASADPFRVHTPVVPDDAACLCMVVEYGPLLPTRVLAPLARFFQKRAG